jgi:glycosyltransferase involved in cell wall biosynthesis
VSTARRIAWIGTYERDYPRSRVLITGLREHGVDVVEVHMPVWETVRHKTGDLAKIGGAARVGARWAGSWARILPRLRGIGPVDAVVAGYPAQPDAPPAWLVAKVLKAPLIVDMMISFADTLAGDRGLVGGIGARALSAVDRVALAVADLVIADTACHADWMAERFGVRRSKFAVVPVGAEPANFPCRPLPDGEPTALFYGKLAPLHGIATIVQAARLPGIPPITMIGSGQLGEWLNDELTANPIPDLRHIPWVPYDQLGREVAAASICLGVFGTSEKASRVVPNKVFQAMAAGRPVITADTPGIREAITDGIEGRLVPAGDAGALAAAMRELAADSSLRQRMGSAAHARFIELGDPKRVAEAFIQALPSLATRSR